MIRNTWIIRDARCLRRLHTDMQLLAYVDYGFPERKPVLPMDGMFDRYLVILFQRMRLKDEADVSGEWAWRKLCRRLA